MRLARIWPFVVLGAIPLSGLPVAVQVGLVVGAMVLMIAQAMIARNPGTRADVDSAKGRAAETYGTDRWHMAPHVDQPRADQTRAEQGTWDCATPDSQSASACDGGGASGDSGGGGAD